MERVEDPACAGETELFFGAEFEPKEKRLEREARAKAVCAGCSGRAACLALALEFREKAGVWGGLNVEERRELARGLRAG